MMTWQPDKELTRKFLKQTLAQAVTSSDQLYDRLTATVLEFSGAIEEIHTLGQEIVQANAHIDQLGARIRQLEADLLTERHF